MAQDLVVRLSFKPIMDGLERFVSFIEDRMRRVQAFNLRIENGARATNQLITQAATVLGANKLREYVNAAGEAEVAQRELETTLRRTGGYTPEFVARLNAQADALERLTRFQSEQITAVQALLASYRVAPADIERVTAAVLDLAAKLRVDPSSAALLVGKTLRGDQEELGRYGIAIDQTKDRLTGLIEAIARFAGGSATAAVPFRELHEAAVNIDQAQKDLGRTLAERLQPFIGGFAAGLKSAWEWLQRITGAVGTMAAGLGLTSENLRPLGELLGKATVAALAFLGPLLAIRTLLIALPVLINPARMAFVALFGVDILDTVRDLQMFSKELGIIQTFNVANWAQRFTGALAIVGAAFAGWQLGSFLNELQVGGMRVKDWAALVVNSVVGLFEALSAWKDKLKTQAVATATEALALLKQRYWEGALAIVEALNSVLGRFGKAIPIDGLKQAVAEARAELKKLQADNAAAVATADAVLRATILNRGDIGDTIRADGRAAVAPKPTAAVTTAAGGVDPFDLTAKQLAQKRELFGLETQLLEAQTARNQAEVDRLTLLIEEKKLTEETKPLGPGAAELVTARIAAETAALKDRRDRQKELFDLQTQQSQAEQRGDQQAADKLSRLAREIHLREELKELGAAALPLIKARLDAEDAATKKERESAEQERTLGEQLGDLERRRAVIEADRYLTAEEKQKRLLPLLEAENKLIAARIALLEDELKRGVSEERKGQISQQLEGLRGQQASIGGAIVENQPQTIAQGIAAAVVRMRDAIGTAAQQLGNLFQQTADSIRTSLGGAFADAILKGGTWAEKTRGFILAVGESFIRNGAQMVADWIMNHTLMAGVKSLFETQATAATAAGTAARTTIRVGETEVVITQQGAQTAAHVAGETAKTGSTGAGAVARGAVRLGETLWHGIQVGLRVAAHVAGEIAQTAITVAQVPLRIAAMLAESGVKLVSAALGALSAMASIPYVGPFLAIAAMGAILAAGGALLKGGLEEGGYNRNGTAVGYTANVGRKTPAGVVPVHGGEWVAPKWMVDDPRYAPVIAALEAERLRTPGLEMGGSLNSGLLGHGKKVVYTTDPLTRWVDTAGHNWWANMMGGSLRGTGNEHAAAESATLSLGADWVAAMQQLPASVTGAIARPSFDAAPAAAGGAGGSGASDVRALMEMIADRIQIVQVGTPTEARAIARNSRARGDIVRIVMEDLGLPPRRG